MDEVHSRYGDSVCRSLGSCSDHDQNSPTEWVGWKSLKLPKKRISKEKTQDGHW